MAYTTAQLDGIVQTLESGLAVGYAEISGQDGRRITYRTVKDIKVAIAYFKALYNDATDAPVSPAPKIRTFYGYGSRGF